ncbi:ATPase [Agaricicola taiwanensis]|uniref:ATPase n=1 Tax=Agaricicola taiwanensis TaxID=591372 RepID=A0A8J3DZS4_9RHOB|nr:SRPBCC family protein [Agaricicola taiwanensis]GGE55378.1 ATPase [Agaricicola taiwanensis]
MNLSFSVYACVSKPVSEVFEAVADPDKLSRYFTTGGAKGRLEAGSTVTWDFHDFPGAFPVEVVEVEPDRRIVLHWGAVEPGKSGPDEEYQTTVTFTFEPVEDGRTKVSVSEEGWRDTAAGLAASYGNCMGWAQMLSALKAWLEYGINLRDGMYR